MVSFSTVYRLTPILLLLLAPGLPREAAGANLFECLGHYTRLNTTIDPLLVGRRDGGLDVRMHDPAVAGLRPLDGLVQLLRRPLGVEGLSRIVQRINRDPRADVSLFQKALDAFRADLSYDEARLANIPRTGPLVVVANHSLFGLDGIAIAEMIRRVRPDVKVVMTQSFEGISGASDVGFFVGTTTNPNARQQNVRALRQMRDWIRDGHVVVIFPAGEPSSVRRPGTRQVFDVPWQRGIERLTDNGRVPVLPVFVEGRPSDFFLRAREWVPRLSSMLLLNELTRLEGSRVRLTPGEVVTPEQLQAAADGEGILPYIRRATYAAGGITEPAPQ